MADQNQANENIDIGLNLSGNALGSVQALTKQMDSLRQSAAQVGSFLNGINKELAAMDKASGAKGNNLGVNTLKRLRQQVDLLTTTPDMIAQRGYSNLSKANQAAQLNALINSNRRFTNPNTMNSILEQYDPRLVQQALKTRLDIAQLNSNTKKAQEAQKALELYQSTMLQMNTKLKGVATMKRLQDQATIEFLNQPLGQLSVQEATRAKLQRNFQTAAQERAVRQYMANPSLLKPTADPFANGGNPSKAIQDNQNKIAATQRLMGQAALDSSATSQKQLENYRKILMTLEDEKVKLQAIQTLRRTNLKATDDDLRAIRKVNDEKLRSKRVEETLSGPLRVKTMDATRIAQLSPDDLIARQATMKKRLAQANQVLFEAENLGNARAKKDAAELVALYQKEVDMLKRRRQELQSSDRNATADRFRDISSSESSGALLGIQGVLMRNYMLWGALVGTIMGSYQFLRDYEMALKQTQAIAQATDTQMVSLSNSILKVSENSRFSAIEITDAATTLAQAGFSMSEIEKTLESVTLLATATGSTLKETVDIATASLGAFQLSAENMPNIVNQITQAMNLSKLDIQKFQLAVQYAGNAASDAGLNFEELLASVSTVANAGVRSGSTLGTGFRQLLSDLMAPSEKFLTILSRLGLTAADVDVRTKGLVGALKTLREAGFTTADAYKSFEVRSVAFYTALANNLTTYDSLVANLDNSSAAMEANEVQMDSLAAQTDRMTNQFKALAETAGAGARDALTDVFHVVGDVTIVIRELVDNEMARMIIQTGTMTVALTGGIYLVKGMAGAIVGLITVLRSASAGMAGVGAATALTMPQIIAIAAAISGAIVLFKALSENSDKLKSSIEESKTSLNAFKDEISNTQGRIQEVDKKLVSLESRFNELKDDPAAVAMEMNKLRDRAVELGITLTTDLKGGIDAVRTGWEELRIALGKELVMNLDRQISELQNLAYLTAQMNGQELKAKGLPTGVQGAKRIGVSEVYDFNTLERSQKKLSVNDAKYADGSYGIVRGFGAGIDATDMLSFLNSIAAANKSKGGGGTGADIQALLNNVYNNAVDAQYMSKDELTKKLPKMQEEANRLMTIINRSRDAFADKSRSSTGQQKQNAQSMVNSINSFAEYAQGVIKNINQLATLFSQQNVAENDRLNQQANVNINQELQSARAKGNQFTSLGNRSAFGNAAKLVQPNKAATLNLSQRKRLEGVMPFIKEAAAKFGVPEDLIIAQMIQESALSNDKSIRGKNADGTYTSAVGLMQVTKAAATDAGFNYGSIYNNDKNNIMAGAKYLSMMKQKTGGTWDDAIRAYYMGAGGLSSYRNGDKSQAGRYAESTAYATKIFSNMYGYQQTQGRYKIMGSLDLPDNTMEILNEKVALEQLLDTAKAEYAKKYSGDISKMSKGDQSAAKQLAANINQLQATISQKAEQTNNVIQAAQSKDEAERKEKQNAEKVVLEQLKYDVSTVENNIKKLGDYDGTMPYPEYIKQLSELLDQYEKLKKEELKKTSEVELMGAATYNGTNLVLPDHVQALADIKLKSDTDKLSADLTEKRKKALKDAAKNFATLILEQNTTFIEEIKLQISKGSDEYQRAMQVAETQSQFDRWGLEDKLAIPELTAQRTLMDDPRYRDNYSDVQRADLSKEIEKKGLDLRKQAEINELELKRELTKSRIAEINQIISDFDVKQAELQTQLLNSANSITDKDIRQTTVEKINKEQQKLSEDVTKNNQELVKLQSDLREFDAKIMATDGKYAPTSFGVGKTVRSIMRQTLEDQSSDQAMANDVQNVIGGINNAFNDLIQTAMDASDNVDDFFKILTGGADESTEAFKAFGYSIVQTIAKVLQDRLVTKFVDLISQMMFGSQGEGGTLSTGGILGTIGSGLAKTISMASSTRVGDNGYTPPKDNSKYSWLETGLRLVGSYFTGNYGAMAGATTTSSPTTASSMFDLNSNMNYNMPDGFTYRSQGGLVQGMGATNVDSVPVMAAPDEYVLPSKVTNAVGLGFLENLRKDPEGVLKSKINVNMGSSSETSAPPSNTNVYVVTREAVPKTLGANDVVAAVADNIARNGQIKQLIKTIVNGK